MGRDLERRGDPGARADPIEIRRGLPGDPSDKQARYLEAAVGGIVVGCLYLPNGNPQPGPKFDYKLAWFQRLHRHAAALLKTGHPVILAGDFNVVPTDDDIYDTASWKDNALLHPAARAGLPKTAKAGLERRGARAASAPRAVHLLELPTESLGA